ncbi:TonB-dependent receptor [Aliarcobacter butzleri]|uniref:TonB-dependent receptor n=1 Tax=Aliarcobacter butzleri TaxID=28197 RepID=UPI001EDC3B54|nr:TonB-dependent siderophore receptor [Aliarcobacter butzleri]MCG3690315.1 TonB-dependent siderophore receptor [Aliarcobacter butzleri]
MKNRFFISVVASLMLSNNVVNAKEISLQEAVDSIVKEYKVTYISKSNSLKDKKIDEKKINYKENALNSLNNILESNDLKAIEEDGIIYIIEKPKKTTNSKTTILEEISVNDSYRTGSAESGYLTENITGVGLWGKRSLQDTPYSMNIISQELIENVQANDMAPIFKMNPITQDGGDQPSGNYNTVIRGFSSNNAVVNGMPLADFYSFTTMEDLERVETISGATGFLYGGGRVGGAVNYVTKKPTLEDKRSITVGNYGGEQYYGHIDLSGQIDEKKVFGYRINALYQDGDSVADVGKEQKFVSLAFDYKPTDNFTLDLNYAHRELERTNQKLPFVISSNTTRPTLDVSKNYSPDWTSVDEENDRVMTSLKWDINEIFTLRSSLIYETSDREIPGDAFAYTRADGLYDASLYRAPKGGQGFDSYAGNIYLDSKFETFGVNHLLTTGYSETYMKYKRDRNWNAGGGYWLTGKTLEEIKNTIIPANPNPHGGRVANWKTQYKNILIGDDIVFNDQWSALVGANYATAISTSYDNGVKDSKYDKSELTPTLSLMYKPFEDLTTYITYIESLEAGEPVGEDYKNEGEILDPYKSKQYEVGAKYSLNENILLTSALFRIEKSNSYEVDTTPKPTLTQDGEQIHQGMELTVTGKVTDDLTLFGGGTLMDIKVEKADNPAIEGKKPTNAASKMAKLYAEYNLPFISGLTVTAGAYYTGEKYGNRLNTDKIPSYTLYDAGLRYKTKLDKYPTTFLLNVSNLTGEDYWASSNYLGDPRSVAVSMKMEF